MHSGFSRSLLVAALFLSASAQGQSERPQPTARSGGDFSSDIHPIVKVPSGVILVKGAWASASDSVTPVPESASVTDSVFRDQYFGMSYKLPQDWIEKYQGPPPSESGRYVLAQISPAETFKGPARGTILITAEDLFFTPLSAANALQFVDYTKDHLQTDYKLELPPTPSTIGGRPFTFFAYWSPVAGLHWYILATEIRCHAIELVLTSRDTKLLEALMLDLNKRMELPVDASPTAGTGGGDVPICIKDYATEVNLLARVDPVFTEHRFNAVPVRIIIDRTGKIRHIHFLSAFPDQAKAITDALSQWRFRPYLQNGKPVEVETGIMFGRSAFRATPGAANATTD